MQPLKDNQPATVQPADVSMRSASSGHHEPYQKAPWVITNMAAETASQIWRHCRRSTLNNFYNRFHHGLRIRGTPNQVRQLHVNETANRPSATWNVAKVVGRHSAANMTLIAMMREQGNVVEYGCLHRLRDRLLHFAVPYRQEREAINLQRA
jgi:hypothetical protein